MEETPTQPQENIVDHPLIDEMQDRHLALSDQSTELYLEMLRHERRQT